MASNHAHPPALEYNFTKNSFVGVLTGVLNSASASGSRRKAAKHFWIQATAGGSSSCATASRFDLCVIVIYSGYAKRPSVRYRYIHTYMRYAIPYNTGTDTVLCAVLYRPYNTGNVVVPALGCVLIQYCMYLFMWPRDLWHAGLRFRSLLNYNTNRVLDRPAV
jgi:hypothetical protein